MRGIDEETLIAVRKSLAAEGLNTDVIDALISLKVRELNPWLPISQAPEDKPIWAFNGQKVIVQWNKCLNEWAVLPVFWSGLTFDRTKPFTHYQELPDDPITKD